MKKYTSFLTLPLLAAVFLTQSARAQFGAGINIAANTPLRSTSDSVPAIRSGASFDLRLNYSFGPRMSTNLTVGRRMLNTSGGFEALAHQYGYTSQKGFTIHSKSAGMTTLALGLGVDLLSTGITGCGIPKPSLILGVGGGVLISDAKIDGEVRSEDGTTVFALQQTGKTSSPFYQVNLDLVAPVNKSLSIVTGAAWTRAASKMDLQKSSNGVSTLSHFTWSDLQLSVGVQISLGKGITEKGIKRSQSVALPAAGEGGTPGDNDPSQPQARTEGQPIGGIVVKGGQNPGAGTRPKGNAMVAGSPIGGIVVKGGQNPRPNSLLYTEDFAINNPTLLTYLGTDQLIIEKGEYPIDYSANPEGRVIVHLHKTGIIHRDLAARSFLFEATSPEGQPFTYSVEPQYVDGVAKDLLVTYKGISEKGIK